MSVASRNGKCKFRNRVLAEAATQKTGNGKEQAQCQNGKTAKRKTAETEGTTVLSVELNAMIK